MTGDRFVLLGLARPRAEWFRSVATWATSGAIPAEFVKCVSDVELRAMLASERTFSAALLDGALPAVDRDLLAAVRDRGCAPMVVDETAGRDWPGLGARAVLGPGLTRDELLDALAAHAERISQGTVLPITANDLSPLTHADVLAVIGTGGSGASTAAMALAQGLAGCPSAVPAPGPVLLADLCLRAEQAMLHDARDVVPGVQELVESHRGRRPTVAEVRGLTFRVVERGYHVLLGLRRPRYWSSIRPRSFETAFASLRQAFGAVVCDITSDLEGEREGGSADVEERNLMSRTAVQHAAAVFAVGLPGMKGLHALARLLTELAEFGAAPQRTVPVINQAPRTPRARAQLTKTLAHLTAESGRGAFGAPVFLPVRRVEDAMRDGVALPQPLPQLLVGAYRATAARVADEAPPGLDLAQPVPVTPGGLGAWTAETQDPQ